MMLNPPSSPVDASRVSDVSLLVMVTVAPGMAAPDESFTLPMTLPYSTCAVLLAVASKPSDRVSMAVTNPRANGPERYASLTVSLLGKRNYAQWLLPLRPTQVNRVLESSRTFVKLFNTLDIAPI